MQFDIYSGNQRGQLLARGPGLCKITHNHFKDIFHKNVEVEICERLFLRMRCMYVASIRSDFH